MSRSLDLFHSHPISVSDYEEWPPLAETARLFVCVLVKHSESYGDCQGSEAVIGQKMILRGTGAGNSRTREQEGTGEFRVVFVRTVSGGGQDIARPFSEVVGAARYIHSQPFNPHSLLPWVPVSTFSFSWFIDKLSKSCQ